jgi:virginiamycin B lyase
MEFPVTTNTGFPLWITSGPDGSLWFAVVGISGPSIDRITTSGVLTVFPVPPVGNFGGITAGLDGNLWYTGIGKIHRITLNGVHTEFPLPNVSSILAGITVGPGGNLWFTELFPNQIGRFIPPSVQTPGTPLPTSILFGWRL